VDFEKCVAVSVGTVPVPASDFGNWSRSTKFNTSRRRITMDLTCPKCKSQDTQKLTMSSDNTLFGKIMRFGAVYVYNVWIPVASVFFGIAFGIVFGLFNGYLGFFAFAGTLVAGFFARKWVKAKTRSKFADLSDNMKQNGFQCKRCEHRFIPVEYLPAGRAQAASA
jgi:hypothetical protein